MDAPQPENLLGELLDVVERVCHLSTSLLSDTHQALAGINSQQKTTEFASTKFTPIDRDPGCRRRILTDEDRMYMIQQGPFQPKLKSYPRNINIVESKQCHFSSEWYNSFPHVEYSITKDAAFCFVCQVFSSGIGNPKADKARDAWTVDGVRAWHKMKSRGKGNAGKLSQHFASSGHKAALNAFLAFQNKSSHLDLLLDKERRKVLIEEEAELQRNREAINTLLDITRTLARQGISFRGSSSEKDGNGNFHQISSLVARHSPSFKRWLDDASKRPHRVDYLSSRSQNEFLDLLAEDVTRRVTAEINQAGMFSIIADTTPDVSHVDQLSVVARYVNAEGNPQERLVDIKVIHDKTGDGHAQGIISSLNEKCLDTADVVFQSYDYTSSMSGIYKGCQAKLKEYLGREVPYFPCLAHRVNTTVEHSCEASDAVCNMFDILQELFVFFTSSPKRYNVFHEIVKKSDVEGVLELRNLSATRWSARADSIRAVWSSYDDIVESLEELKDSDDPKTKTSNLLGRVKSFEFIIMLMFMRNVMMKTKILTKEVQSVDINIVDTLEAAQATIATLRHLRDDETNLDNQIDAAVVFSAQHEIDAEDEYQRNHRPRRRPRRFDERPETIATLTFKNFYRKEFIQVLDVQIQNLTANVKAAYDILTPAINLLLPPFNKEPEPEEFEALVKMLPETLKPDVSALNVELTMFRHHCQANKPDVKSLAEAAHCAKVLNSIFPLTSRCYHLILTAPITSASSERSFSKLKLIKTVLRSVMKQERLKSLMMLGCETDITDSINLDEIVDRWAKTRRLISVG